MRLGFVVTAIAFGLGLAGCGAGTTIGSGTSGIPGGGASPTPRPSGTPAVTATPTPTPVPTATPTPSPTPIPIVSDSLFAGVGSGIDIFSTSGTLSDMFATTTGADYFGLDDAGDAFTIVDNSDFTITIAKYGIGENAPSATYAATSARPQLILTGRNGTLVAEGAGVDASNNATAIYDVWDPGTSGAPSRTITYANESEVILGGTIGSDGTLYLPYNDATGQVRYDIVTAGTSAVSRTIVESIAAPHTNFAPNVIALGPDGTLYAGEWTYETPDANAGLYVYPASGSETMVKTGASNPTGIDFDSSGNVYVANSNATIGPDATLGSDTAHVLSEFAPHATSLVRQVSMGLDDPQDLAVDTDGTAYLAEYVNAGQTSGSIAVVAPAATAAATFAGMLNVSNIVLYDGTRVRSYRQRGTAGHAAGARALRLHGATTRSVRQRISTICCAMNKPFPLK